MVTVAIPETWGELIAQTTAEPADVYPVAVGPVELDGGVWLARSLSEQATEAGRCGDQILAIARGTRASYRHLPDRQRAVFGVHDAARWTRGRTLVAPVSRYELTVSGEAISYELALAEQVVERRADEWEKAVGAFVWLRWLIGAEDSITYPLW